MASANYSGFCSQTFDPETARKMLAPLLIHPPSEIVDLPLPPDSDPHRALMHITEVMHQLERSDHVAKFHTSLVDCTWEMIWPWVSCFLGLTKRKEYQTSKELDDIVSTVACFFHVVVKTRSRRELAERLPTPDSSNFIAFLYTQTNSALNPVLSEAWIWTHYYGSRRAFNAVCRAADAVMDLVSRLTPLRGYPLSSTANDFLPRLESLAETEGRNTLCEILMGRFKSEVYPLRLSYDRDRLVDTDILHTIMSTIGNATGDLPHFKHTLICNSYPQLITNTLSLLCFSPAKRFTSSPQISGERYEIYTRLCCVISAMTYLKYCFTIDGPNQILQTLRYRHPARGVLMSFVKAIQLAREAEKAHPGMTDNMRALCRTICTESCRLLWMICSACTIYRAIDRRVRKSVLAIEKAKSVWDVLKVISVYPRFKGLWMDFRSMPDDIDLLEYRKYTYEFCLMRVCSNEQCSSQKPFTNQPRRCSGCRVTIYCSSACQRAHWESGHQEVCLATKSKLAAGHSPPLSDLERAYIHTVIHLEMQRRSELAFEAVSKQGLLSETGKPLLYITCVDCRISETPSPVTEEYQVLSGPILKRLDLPSAVKKTIDGIIRANNFRVLIGLGIVTEDSGKLKFLIKGMRFEAIDTEPTMELGVFDHELIYCDEDASVRPCTRKGFP